MITVRYQVWFQLNGKLQKLESMDIGSFGKAVAEMQASFPNRPLTFTSTIIDAPEVTINDVKWHT